MGFGGQEIRVLSEARGLRERGHDVMLYCASGARIGEEAARYGVPATKLPIARKTPRAILALARALASRRFDVVCTHSSTDSWLAALALRTMAPRPALVRMRHVSVPVPDNPATRWLYRRATARIVTTGEALRDELVRNLDIAADRIDSVPTGIDSQAFAARDKWSARRALGLPEDVPLVGIVATLRSWKGHRHLLEAMTHLQHRDARLVIVGDGPQREALVEQARTLDIVPRVVFAGHRDDIADWLASFDVFALPSYANEGVPQALLQAMAAGVPCVTTDVGAIPEIARHDDTAWIVAREDPRALARGIDRVLDDPALGRRLAGRARALVTSRHGYQAMLDRMEAIYRRAIAERGTGAGRRRR